MRIPEIFKAELYCVAMPLGLHFLLLWIGIPFPIPAILQGVLSLQLLMLWYAWHKKEVKK